MQKDLREELVRRLDVLVEYQRVGIRIPPGAKPNRNGWLSIHSLYRTDKNPSAAINVGPDLKCRGLYIDFGENGLKGKPWLVKSLFDILAEHGPYFDWQQAQYDLGRKYGVVTWPKGDGISCRRRDKAAPTLDDVERFRKNLTPEVLQYLRDKRGLTEETIARFEIGWDPGRERNTIPVYEAAPIGKRLVNIRLHNSKKTPKTLNWPGFGEARLFGLERLAAAPPGSIVVVTEGELDCILAEQETGYIGVSSTNGVKAFKNEWVKHFNGHHVVLMYDSDKEGREFVHQHLLAHFKPAVESGQVLSLKVVWLYDKPDKEHKDVTDWIVKDGGSGEALKKLIADTPPYTYPTSKSHLEDPIELDSFVLIDQSDFAGRRVTVDLQVFGENTVAYHAPAKLHVTHCPSLREGKCTGPKGKEGACLSEIHIPLGNRVQIASVRATDSQLQRYLRDFVCDRDKQPTIRINDEDRITLREVWAHQVFGPMQFDPGHQIEKPIYVIGGDPISIGKYRATGHIISTYRDQQPTLLVDTLQHLEEDYQTFSLDRARPHLQKLKEMFVEEIVEDLSHHVTRIYQRPHMHLAVLLVLCSPLWFNFPKEGRIRGWLSAILLGDTGTGKTTVSQNIFEHARVGDRVSGMTSSRTGITYGIDWDYRKGWRIQAGALLKMSHQALIVDEAQDIKLDEIKTMAEGIETGITKIDRIAARTFECRTRCIFSCNPRHPKIPSEQLTLGDFDHGALSLDGLFPSMLIRRVDLCLFASQDDISNKEEIFNPPEDVEPQRVTSDDLRSLIFFAWNLQPEQIVFAPGAAERIRAYSSELSQKFGCGKPPLVYPEDFRKTLARLCVAYAVCDLSCNDDFTQVIVKKGHVADMFDFIDNIYSAENCRLHKVAEEYKRRHGLADEEEIKAKFDNILNKDNDQTHRFLCIMGKLLTGERFKQDDLSKMLDVTRGTITRDMKVFVDHRLTDSNRFGVKKSAKLTRFLGRMEKERPEWYENLNSKIETAERTL